jgi:ABC-type Na+ transport system ATPase subunit NatA
MDNEEENPIKIMCQKNSNISHMKYVYDLISEESTKNIDNFTKYFMLKIYYKKRILKIEISN